MKLKLIFLPANGCKRGRRGDARRAGTVDGARLERAQFAAHARHRVVIHALVRIWCYALHAVGDAGGEKSRLKLLRFKSPLVIFCSQRCSHK